MARRPKPWFRKRRGWFVTIDGKQIHLGNDKGLKNLRARELDEDVTTISRTKDSTVVIRKELPAAPQEVFRAWTEKREMEEFLAPSDTMTTDVSEVDATVGGRFCLTMNENAAYIARGEYCRVQRPNTLSFTWAWDNADHEKNEGQITIQLRPSKTGTEVVFIHERLSSQQSRDSHQEGWEGVFNRLERKLGADLGS